MQKLKRDNLCSKLEGKRKIITHPEGKIGHSAGC
jgi:hypothetical protein